MFVEFLLSIPYDTYQTSLHSLDGKAKDLLLRVIGKALESNPDLDLSKYTVLL